jgi:hypothetical protein
LWRHQTLLFFLKKMQRRQVTNWWPVRIACRGRAKVATG